MEAFSESNFENIVSGIDQNYRLNFQELIKESKHKTHKCQLLCYESKPNLLESEECSRNCFKPMLYIKKNVNTLIENQKEKYEKCKFEVKKKNISNIIASRAENERCITNYVKDLDKLKDEIVYVYKGYMKNFDVLLTNNIEMTPVKKL